MLLGNDLYTDNTKYDITVSGEVSSKGLLINGNAIINNCNMTVNSYSTSILSIDSLISNNSTYNLTSTEESGIALLGDLILSGCTLDIHSHNCGIQTQNNSIYFNDCDCTIENSSKVFSMGIYSPKDVIATNTNLVISTDIIESDHKSNAYCVPIYTRGYFVLNGGSIKARHFPFTKENGYTGIFGIMAAKGITIPENYLLQNVDEYYEAIDDNSGDPKGSNLEDYMTESFENGKTDLIRNLNYEWITISAPVVSGDSSPVLAPQDKKIPTIYIGDNKPEITINILENKYISGDNTKSARAPIIIENGRTYLGVRDIAYALGIDPMAIKWDSKTKTASISKAGAVIEVTQGSKDIKITYGGYVYTKTSDASAIISNNRIYLPFRLLFQIFGYTVNWDETTKTITCK